MFLREGAAGWYEEIQAKNLNWEQLKEALIKYYAPTNYNKYLIKKAGSMKQQPGEDVVSYFDRMRIPFSRMKPKPEEKTVSTHVFQGLYPQTRK